MKARPSESGGAPTACYVYRGVGLAGAGMKGITKGGGGKGLAGRVINFIGCTFGAGMSETVVRDMVSRILEAEASSGPEPEPA